MCNKLFQPAKVFDHVFKLLEEGDKLGELNKLNLLLYGPTQVPCETKGGETEAAETRVKTNRHSLCSTESSDLITFSVRFQSLDRSEHD